MYCPAACLHLHLHLYRLSCSKEYRGIQAVAFSPDGTRLASISTDNSHSLHLWDWARRVQLCQPRKSQAGAPPAVYGVVWSKYEPDRYRLPMACTAGVMAP